VDSSPIAPNSSQGQKGRLCDYGPTRIVIVITAYNEAARIGKVVSRVKSVLPGATVLVEVRAESYPRIGESRLGTRLTRNILRRFGPVEISYFIGEPPRDSTQLYSQHVVQKPVSNGQVKDVFALPGYSQIGDALVAGDYLDPGRPALL
jgi:hypothetical protein